MRTKVIRRNITEIRENTKDNFRVLYGDKSSFYLLKVIIRRIKDGTEKIFYFKQSQLHDVFDSIHFSTTVERGKFKVKWFNIQPLSDEWKVYLPEEIKKLVDKAIIELQTNDPIFLEKEFNINERSVTHRLGMYLAALFPDEDVDCEYNREYNDGIDEYLAKNLELPKIEVGITLKDTEAKTVFPDVIIHRRNKRRNLLALEVKMAWKKGSGLLDELKARGYKYELNYDYSAYLILGPGKNYKIKWF